ncbi:MAG: DUF4864 domain-containing protein [Rhodobacteraceae bacterium]|nr:DUF4864 domain-containing protein [Paracoccaceae bacterium]
MTRLIAMMFATLLLSLPVRADDAARQVISDQIAAFQQDDFEAAFTYASPMIKGIFGTPQRFGQMVRDGYPMVWRPSDVEFLEAEQIGKALVQDVLIRDGEGVLYEVEYEMIQGEDGWKINGVRVKRAPEGLA